MAEYIVNNGMKVTEEALIEIYRLHSFATFNERDYNAWKQSRIEQGVIKEIKQEENMKLDLQFFGNRGAGSGKAGRKGGGGGSTGKSGGASPARKEYEAATRKTNSFAKRYPDMQDKWASGKISDRQWKKFNADYNSAVEAERKARQRYYEEG